MTDWRTALSPHLGLYRLDPLCSLLYLGLPSLQACSASVPLREVRRAESQAVSVSGEIIRSDCLPALRSMPADSVDAIVTDPPAGIAFMGKHWDRDKGGRREWIAWLAEVMGEGLRVLRPGGYAFVWALPRTSHWTATALEDAGFEIRDILTHVFGSGFPKSKALMKPAAEMWLLAHKPFDMEHWMATLTATVDHLEEALCQEVDLCAAMDTPSSSAGLIGCLSTVRSWRLILDGLWLAKSTFTTGTASSLTTALRTLSFSLSQTTPESIIEGLTHQSASLSPVATADALFSALRQSLPLTLTPSATERAGARAAFSAALERLSPPGVSVAPTGPGRSRSASEHWILARKPGPLRHLRIDDCRVSGAPDPGSWYRQRTPNTADGRIGQKAALIEAMNQGLMAPPSGRWPANFVMSHCPPALDEAGNVIAPGCERVGTKRVRTGMAHEPDRESPRGVAVLHSPGRGEAFGYAGEDGREEVSAYRCAPGCPVALMDEQSGVSGSGSGKAKVSAGTKRGTGTWAQAHGMQRPGAVNVGVRDFGDAGGASRFFHCFEPDPFVYQAKASRRDRGEGNRHPTVKSTALMRHLCRLIAAPGDLVLDMFAGSGSTGVAALAEGMRFIGIEQDAESVETARRRLSAVAPAPAERPGQLSLIG